MGGATRPRQYSSDSRQPMGDIGWQETALWNTCKRRKIEAYQDANFVITDGIHKLRRRH